MKFTKTIILTILLYSFNLINLTAQNQKYGNTIKKEDLKDLTEATENDLKTKDIRIDGDNFPIYNIEGNRIKGIKLMEALESKKYTIDLYIDKDKGIKAGLLRKLRKN